MFIRSDADKAVAKFTEILLNLTTRPLSQHEAEHGRVIALGVIDEPTKTVVLEWLVQEGFDPATVFNCMNKDQSYVAIRKFPFEGSSVKLSRRSEIEAQREAVRDAVVGYLADGMSREAVRTRLSLLGTPHEQITNAFHYVAHSRRYDS